MSRLAQKRGMVGGQRVDHGGERFAGRVLHDAAVVGVKGAMSAGPQQTPQPRCYEIFFTGLEVQPEGAMREFADGVEFRRGERQGRNSRPVTMLPRQWSVPCKGGRDRG